MVNLELYRVFYTVAKCGSLTRAAEELYISQPAVSQAIKQLENQLGTSLFNRTHKGMELSVQGGKLIFKQVEEALTLLDGAENMLIELKTTATGTIRIGATDSIFSNLIADKIVEFHEMYPAVKFDLITGTTMDTIAQLKDNKCDIVFINLPVDDKEVVLSGSVSLLSDIFVANEKFSELKNSVVPIKKLQEYPILMMEKNTVARHATDAYLSSLGITLQPDIEVANWDLMLKLAAKGMGIGCVPREYCKKYLNSGELFEVAINPTLPVRGVGMALPKNVPVPFALREFMALFK
ncbi:MAG: LysR family transcriptional regulator [Clostridia bacterium]|nr:LysR family transcriptional regulator [Clostridia bacterium]MCD8309506.1 LysR family transcriptional regulator [Clostridia bacterium]